ncbi:MAG TPA: HAD-IIIC family phosphatase [Kofleriaceae bacterium]|nr:HAD-IIIC family phosphatase [Kofleriaceae bacterium]
MTTRGGEPLTPDSSTGVFQRRWRELSASPGSLRPVSIAVAASFTVDTLLPYLGGLLAQRGLYAKFTAAPFGQIYQSLLDPGSEVRAAEADVTLVLPRLEDLCARPLGDLALIDPARIGEARAEVLAEIDRLCGALASFEAATAGTLLVGTLPAPPSTPLGVLDASHPASLVQLGRECNLALWSAAQKRRRMRLVDVDQVVAELGASRAWDARMALLAGCPLSTAGLRHLAAHLTRVIAALFVPAAKVVVLDLDNTLWGGIVGEDGPAGIAIGPSGLGAAFQAFQDALLALRAQGMLLAIASKNNEADAFEVFDNHPGMRIRRDHLAAHRISWQSKSESLRELAAELSLGVDSFVFVDDSPTECAEVKSVLPEVTVVQLPPDPARYVEVLRAVPQLDRMTLTDEDRMRAMAYAAEKARTAARAEAEGDPDALRAHLRSLGLVVQIRRIGDADVARAAQLTQKTNQFNLTTVRRSEADVEAMRRDPAWRLYALDVTDRFGDYGTTGLVFARRVDDATWDLDTVLLSCRVLGRGVESALLRVVTEDLIAAGARRLTGRLIPTKKNAPVRDFLPRHGFVAASGAAPGEGPGELFVKEPLPGQAFDDGHVTAQLEPGPQ